MRLDASGSFVSAVLCCLIGAGRSSAADLDITAYGARAAATTDNLKAIQDAINAAKAAGVNVRVPPGTYGYSGVIDLPGPVRLYGDGASSVLNALDPLHETIFVTGDGASVSGLTLTIGYVGARRQDPFACQRITLREATHWTVDRVVIDGGSAAGMMSSGGRHGVFSNNRVMNTLADGIHMTGGSAYIDVVNNQVSHTGDDGIAVVSYLGGGLDHDITATNNVVHDNAWGRGMTVVGGDKIAYTNNYVYNVPNWSCFYIAQESSYNTYPATNVTLRNNTARNCAQARGNHGGVLVWGDAQANSDIRLSENLIAQDNGNPTITIAGKNRNVSLDKNKIDGVAARIQTPSQVIRNRPYVSGPAGYTP